MNEIGQRCIFDFAGLGLKRVLSDDVDCHHLVCIAPFYREQGIAHRWRSHQSLLRDPCPPREVAMCRWFAYISNSERCLLEDVLIDPAHSLAKQVHDHYLPKLTHHEPAEDPEATAKEIAMRNKLFNADGLGMGW